MSMTEKLGGPAARGPLPGTGGPRGPREMASRFALLPLRLFLGVAFLYAGLDKYTDAGLFSDAMSLDAMETILEHSRESAAAPWLADFFLEHPAVFGHGVAIAELAVGFAVLVGLGTRLAAAGGGLLVLCFWLTVSWSTEPFYFGSDLPLLAGFATLLLAGGGPFALERLLPALGLRRSRGLFG